MKKETLFTWRVELSKTEKYWEGWFRGLSSLFLSCPVPKLLLLAGEISVLLWKPPVFSKRKEIRPLHFRLLYGRLGNVIWFDLVVQEWTDLTKTLL